MQWIDETDTQGRKQVNHALVLAGNEPLLPAFAEFWKRVLADGCARAAATGWTALSIEIADRQWPEDEPGYLCAIFVNGQQRPCGGIGAYYLRGVAFDCIQPRGDDNDAFNRRQIRWFLDHYQLLKLAAQASEVRPLLDRITAIRPMPVSAATAFGWFDLQLERDTFGTLPTEDQEMLLGMDRAPADPLQELLAGVTGHDARDVVAELSEALIAYTPPYFETICCDIRDGVENGRRALCYDISCPQFPDDGATVVNDRLHRAATRLVLQMTALQGGAFPGLAIRLERQRDGTWSRSLRPLSDRGLATVH